MPLLEIKEMLRHSLRGRAKKLIARRLGVDVKTVRKYVRAAEEYGLTREVRTASSAHVVFAVATKICHQELSRPRGEGWKWCTRHRERVRNLLEHGTTVSEIRSALERLGVRVSASTLYRFVVSEFPHRSRAATESRVEGPAGPPKVIAPPNQKRLTPQAERRDDEVEDGRMLRLLKRHEIQVLLRADHTQEEVAELAGVAVSSVRRVGKEEPVEHEDDAAERARRRIGRPSVVKKFRQFVQGTLRTRPDLDAAEILHQARLVGYRGCDSAFYGLVASLRSKGGEPVSRFEKLPTKRTKDHRRKMGLESQRPPAASSERPHHEAREDSNSERATVVPKQGCQSTYSLRLEYVKGTPNGCAIAEKDLLSDWHRDFAISGQHTLEQLSSIVLQILRWDPNRLYEFRIGVRLYAHMGDDSLVVDMQEPGLSCDIPVKLVGLAQGDTFTYLFDFGDCHTFRLTVLAIEPPVAGQQLPVMLSYRGNDLIQSSHSRQRRALRSAQSKPPSVGPPVARRKKGTVRFVRDADRETLAQWRKSNDKRLWQKAVAILENWSLSLEEIAQKIEKSPTQLRSWIKAYNRQGLEGLIRKQRSVSDQRHASLELKRRRILEILHGRPRAYGINRSNWNLRSLATAYTGQHGEAISRSTASRLVRDSGYVMKKMRRVLSSPDPRYREKVDLLLSVTERSNAATQERLKSGHAVGCVSIV